MQFPFPPATIEERIDEEEQSLARLSLSALQYMYDYGTAWEGWLRHHRGNLRFLADDEYDLFEAMRLSTRLKSVERNIRRTGRRNELLRGKLLEKRTEMP